MKLNVCCTAFLKEMRSTYQKLYLEKSDWKCKVAGAEMPSLIIPKFMIYLGGFTPAPEDHVTEGYWFLLASHTLDGFSRCSSNAVIWNFECCEDQFRVDMFNYNWHYNTSVAMILLLLSIIVHDIIGKRREDYAFVQCMAWMPLLNTLNNSWAGVPLHRSTGDRIETLWDNGRPKWKLNFGCRWPVWNWAV